MREAQYSDVAWVADTTVSGDGWGAGIRVGGPDPGSAVHHPGHYTSHPSGVECISITEHMNFCLGNAIKYIWRAGLKSDDPDQDLAKAIWYLERERARLKR